MKKSIGFCEFTDSFRNMDRQENFSYNWLKALYEYLEQYEEDTGEEIELDTIALCCEYTEYESFAELQKNYTDIDSFDDLENNTTVIYIGDYQDEESPFIIQNF